MYARGSIECAQALRDTFPCLSIDYKGEDAANNDVDGPLDKNLVSTGFRAGVVSVVFAN